MTKKPKIPPLPQKGGSYTVDSRNRLQKDTPADPPKDQPQDSPQAKEGVTDA